MPEAVLVVTALAFAAVNGANDGSALLSLGQKIRSLPPYVFLLVLLVALVVVPVVLGTAVARTLTERLVTLEGPEGQQALAVAVVCAVLVVGVLSWRALPTSLTLALVGALAGAGLGGGLPVSWGAIGRVLLAGAAAPFVGGLIGYALSRGIGRVSVGTQRTRRVAQAHGLAFATQSVAYAANDGQKIFAVYLVASGGAGIGWGTTTLLAACFGVGVLFGLRRVSGTLTGSILAVRPANAVLAEFAAAGAVLGSAALAAPVSMTQSVAGALVGTGVSESYRRVRWRAAGRLGLAWVLTLPASLALAAIAALLLARGGTS